MADPAEPERLPTIQHRGSDTNPGRRGNDLHSPRRSPLTERDRHDAYEALQQAFGDRTDTVIELLRPDHDALATKEDLASGQTRTMMLGLVGSVTALSATQLVIAALG